MFSLPISGMLVGGPDLITIMTTTVVYKRAFEFSKFIKSIKCLIWEGFAFVLFIC